MFPWCDCDNNTKFHTAHLFSKINRSCNRTAWKALSLPTWFYLPSFRNVIVVFVRIWKLPGAVTWNVAQTEILNKLHESWLFCHIQFVFERASSHLIFFRCERKQEFIDLWWLKFFILSLLTQWILRIGFNTGQFLVMKMHNFVHSGSSAKWNHILH